MAEETMAPVIEAEQVVVEQDVEVSGLPSDVDNQTTFSFDEADIKDGKFDGRWSNPKEMADYIKNMEDKHSALSREVADKTKADNAEIETTSTEVKAQQLKDETIESLIPEYIANGMVVTPEMQTALSEVGMTEQEIKLGAYELKEAIDKNSDYVGGQENYDIIMDYHAKTMTDDEKRSFNHSIQNTNNSEALMVGLQTMYERGSGDVDTAVPDRVRGNPTPATIQGYGNKAELLRDKKYADSRNASAADKTKYRARLAITPDNVWKN